MNPTPPNSGSGVGSAALPPEARELAALQAQMLRPAANVNRDGSFELGWGLALLCAGFGTYFSVALTHSRWFSGWTSWIGFLPLLMAAFAPYAVPKIIQRFITWPRTGYVANPNEITLGYLIRLMIFGGAVGGCLGLLFTIGYQALNPVNHGRPGADTTKFVWAGIKFLVCLGVVVYLGPKVIRKRRPLPAAYDAAIINSALRQTPAGRSQLRLVKVVIFAMFAGIPICVFGCVIGLALWNRSLLQRTELQGPQVVMASFLVATNALLYIMGGGLALKPNRWKWLLLPVMILAPILLAPVIPNPATGPSVPVIFQGMSPVMLCLGAVWFLSGLIALAIFVRANPLPQPTEAQ